MPHVTLKRNPQVPALSSHKVLGPGFSGRGIPKEVAATINNIGPGLAKVGPTSNFGHFSILSKLTLTFDMLAGRLELFPMLILFTPSTWKK